MNRREAFPQWKTDVRNVAFRVLLPHQRRSGFGRRRLLGGVGLSRVEQLLRQVAAIPDHGPRRVAGPLRLLADSDWAREVARRQCLLCTYDAHETGVVEDGIDGGAVVAGDWFNLAHPWPLRTVLEMIAWQPEVLGANRENHIVRSTSVVVESVRYGKGRIEYSHLRCGGPGRGLLRLAFAPRSVTADGKPLPRRTDLSAERFHGPAACQRRLPGGRPSRRLPASDGRGRRSASRRLAAIGSSTRGPGRSSSSRDALRPATARSMLHVAVARRARRPHSSSMATRSG